MSLVYDITELHELKFAFNCLFQDCHFGDSTSVSADEGEASLVKIFDAEVVFKQIDKNKNGRIDIHEFKVSDMQMYCCIVLPIIAQLFTLCQ
jgi:hypothetical protein